MSDGAVITAQPKKRLDDRLNPILVKEVRQALRGRYFRVLFWLTLVLATVIGVTVVARAASQETVGNIGPEFFMWIFGVLAAAVHAFVPFSAFLATSSEWDENTWDLLVISNLRPRQLVLGKLWSAVIQAMLFYSAFAPFLVFAFLLNGIDLLSIVVILSGSMLTCTALSLTGIALSSLSRVRFMRILLMAMFGAALMVIAGSTIGLASVVVNFPNLLRDSQAQVALAAYATLAVAIAGLAFATATARLAHDEENRSTALRIVSVLVVLAAAGWSTWAAREINDVDPIWLCQFLAALIVFIPLTLFTTEEERLRRAVAKRVPKNPLLALLCAPFLPGGGRGALLFVLLAALGLASVPIAVLVANWGVGHIDDPLLRTLRVVAVIYGYLALHIAAIAGFASLFARTRGPRTAVRWTILASVPVAVFAPAVAGLFFRVDSWMRLDHPLNPIAVIDDLRPSFPHSSSYNVAVALVWLALGALAALLLNASRALAGVREVLAASRARRAS